MDAHLGASRLVGMQRSLPCATPGRTVNAGMKATAAADIANVLLSSSEVVVSNALNGSLTRALFGTPITICRAVSQS